MKCSSRAQALALIVMLSTNSATSSADTQKPEWADVSLFYTTAVVLELHPLDLSSKKVDLGTTLLLDRNLRFVVTRTISVGAAGAIDPTGKGEQYYQVEVYRFASEAGKCTVPGRGGYIDCTSNDKLFALPSAELDKLLSNGLIVRGHLPDWFPEVRVGASIQLPFKLRPSLNGHPRDITSDAALGASLALRWRISKEHDYFASLAATAGFSLLPIAGNQLDDGESHTSVVTVPGFTWSVGVVTELNAFQLGLFAGKDYASGDAASSWIYDKEWWYALSIGFAFYGPSVLGPRSSGRGDQ